MKWFKRLRDSSPTEFSDDTVALLASHGVDVATFDDDTTAGALLQARGDLDGAAAAYRRADERGDAQGAGCLGTVLERRGDLQGAEAAYRRADEREDATGACNLGRLLQRRGDLAGAEEAYRRAEERGHIGGTRGLVWLLFERGDAEGAVTAFLRAEEQETEYDRLRDDVGAACNRRDTGHS